MDHSSCSSLKCLSIYLHFIHLMGVSCFCCTRPGRCLESIFNHTTIFLYFLRILETRFSKCHDPFFFSREVINILRGILLTPSICSNHTHLSLQRKTPNSQAPTRSPLLCVATWAHSGDSPFPSDPLLSSFSISKSPLKILFRLEFHFLFYYFNGNNNFEYGRIICNSNLIASWFSWYIII